MGEDTYIALIRYLIGVHPGSPETGNCKLSGERKTGQLTDSVAVEIKPDGNPPDVQASGYLLLLDTEHINRSGGPRITISEIHPVTRFQVCTATPPKCDCGSGWKDLKTDRKKLGFIPRS